MPGGVFFIDHIPRPGDNGHALRARGSRTVEQWAKFVRMYLTSSFLSVESRLNP